MSDSPSKVSSFARVKLVAAWVILAICVVGTPDAYSHGATRCTRTGASVMRSPDGEWVARVYGKLCDLGIESSAAVMVDLARAKLPGSAVTVLSVDMPSNKSLWPKPIWVSAKELLIQLPASANVALQMASLQGIAISLKFCPSASTDRGEWLAYRAAYHKWIEDTAAWIRTEKRNPRTAGPKPVQPKPPEAQGNSCTP